ncbi:ubiquitin carboxyl-terminal family 1 [Phlyctema vagabunda]|uniref:Ubiquitin carboxyl-terminal hydrolase n=1 Tax=Phlyctema vagabunda TaxID=108571 RepID=A0ABR4PS76_9HELO
MDETWQPPAAATENGRRRSSRLSSISKCETADLDGPRNGEPVESNENQPRRSNRRRQPPANIEPAESIQELLKPVTDEERDNWKGWVELESDPALFSHVLRQYGVKDVQIQEVLGLDDDMLGVLPMPTYGLVFLFKYRDSDSEEEEQQISSCPENVWFANQTTTSACATFALLNIVMNISELRLGHELSAFRDVTKSLTPARRGYKLGHNGFIRGIHNSSARRTDIRNADLALANEVEDWTRARNTKKRNFKGRKKTSKKSNDDDEPGFHFIAYVPIDGEVWRLDGLQRLPVNLGAYEGRWVTTARDNIYQRISQHDEDGLQFNLLALCKGPLKQISEELAQLQCSMIAAEARLDSLIPDWKAFLEVGKTAPPSESGEEYGITKDILSAACIPQPIQAQITDVETDPGRLLDLYKELKRNQGQLQQSYVQEVALIGQDEDHAPTGTADLASMIHASIEALAEANVLEEIMQDLQE